MNRADPHTNWLCVAFCLYAVTSLLVVALILCAEGHWVLALVTAVAMAAIWRVAYEEVR